MLSTEKKKSKFYKLNKFSTLCSNNINKLQLLTMLSDYYFDMFSYDYKLARVHTI